MVDLVTALVAGAAGVGIGGVVSYFVFFSRPKEVKVRAVARDQSGTPGPAIISASELDRSRREMRTVIVERDLLSSALMKLYEAENEGRITREERETIAKRYSDQIKDLQAKLKDVELIVEVGELEKLRDELMSLFNEKVGNIEARLDQAKERLGASAPQVGRKEPVAKVERGGDLERAVERRARPEMSESERRVKEIRDEVMDALTKLEQIDIEKKQET